MTHCYNYIQIYIFLFLSLLERENPTKYLLSDLLQSELKVKLLKLEGARAPVPYNWRRH